MERKSKAEDEEEHGLSSLESSLALLAGCNDQSESLGQCSGLFPGAVPPGTCSGSRWCVLLVLSYPSPCMPWEEEREGSNLEGKALLQSFPTCPMLSLRTTGVDRPTVKP